jgi:HK97 gp10 family phage protein
MAGLIRMTVTRFKNRFGEIIGRAETEKQHVLDITGEKLVASAKGYSRVDTGEMQEGWEWDHFDEDTIVVFNEVEHTIFNEFGTMYMTAQPMITPALEEHKDGFIAAMTTVYK